MAGNPIALRSQDGIISPAQRDFSLILSATYKFKCPCMMLLKGFSNRLRPRFLFTPFFGFFFGGCVGVMVVGGFFLGAHTGRSGGAVPIVTQLPSSGGIRGGGRVLAAARDGSSYSGQR